MTPEQCKVLGLEVEYAADGKVFTAFSKPHGWVPTSCHDILEAIADRHAAQIAALTAENAAMRAQITDLLPRLDADALMIGVLDRALAAAEQREKVLREALVTIADAIRAAEGETLEKVAVMLEHRGGAMATCDIGDERIATAWRDMATAIRSLISSDTKGEG